MRVPARSRADFEAAIRAEGRLRALGFPEFSIHPQGEREEYWPVVYVEPIAGNESFFGLDMAAEPRSRAVLDYMRDAGRPAISPPMRRTSSRAM